jgi:hypothetical protein
MITGRVFKRAVFCGIFGNIQLWQLNIGIRYEGIGKVPFEYQIMCGMGYLQGNNVALFMKQSYNYTHKVKG